MKHMTVASLLLTTLVLTFSVDLPCVGCKTIQLTSSQINSTVKNQSRKFDNFVDFTDEGDQLAVESTGSVAATTTDIKKDLLGSKTSVSTTARQCANVNKAVYPVIPVIIAALVGLIGSIILSNIVRLVFKKKKEKEDDFETSSEYGVPSYGYGRRTSKGNLFGFDLGNFNFVKLAKNVLTAIEKVY